MPLLFSIGIQSVLEELAHSLERGEHVCAFLDDENLLCPPTRVEPLFKVLSEALLRHAGIHFHQGKTNTWNKAGVVLDNVGDLGSDTWQPKGIKVLGTPIGFEGTGVVEGFSDSHGSTMRMANLAPK